jgi:hypothetical protein
MTDCIVIQIQKAPLNKILVDLHQAPNMPVNPIGVTELQCDPATLPPWNTAQGVRLRGEKVLQSLLDSHDDVRQALLTQLNNAQANSCRIKFWLRHFGPAEQICWEALWRPGRNFLALNRRWPIGRIAGTRPRPVIDLGSNPIDNTHPLRVLAVISAAGVRAKAQWNSLYEAVQRGRQPQFPIHITVLTGEQELSDQIFQQANADPNLVLKPIANTSIDLERAIETAMPHVIHFFCHGSSTFSTPRLEIATFDSFDGANPVEKPVVLDAEQLSNLRSIREAWLVTLNCCEGGAGSKEIASLTYSLVTLGAAAVVGMTESLEVLDAHEFCKEFYPEVFQTIERAVSEARIKGRSTLEWDDALYAPRIAIRDKHPNGPDDERQWTLPVLYMQLEPIQLHSPPPGPAPAESPVTRKSRDETLAGLFRTLSPEQAELLRQELQKMQQEEPEN